MIRTLGGERAIAGTSPATGWSVLRKPCYDILKVCLSTDSIRISPDLGGKRSKMELREGLSGQLGWSMGHPFTQLRRGHLLPLGWSETHDPASTRG